jgi:hypothetical protein
LSVVSPLEIVLVIGGEFCLMGLVWGGGFGKVYASDLGGRCLVVLVVFAYPFITTFQVIDLNFLLLPNKTPLLYRFRNSPTSDSLLNPFSNSHSIIEMLG